MTDVFQELAAHFPPEAIHWRLGSTNQKSVARETGNQYAKPTKGQPLAYINARDVMERLDAVVGPENWRDSYTETPKRLICTLELCIGNRWVHKSDGAGDTNMEGEKGGLSDAFKRAAVKFGVGRYLYACKTPWIDLDDRGNIPRDFDGKKYLPRYNEPDYMALVREHFDIIVQVKAHLQNGEVEEARAAYKELDVELQKALWKAPTKGGIWTTHERDVMKGLK